MADSDMTEEELVRNFELIKLEICFPRSEKLLDFFVFCRRFFLESKKSWMTCPPLNRTPWP